MSEPTGWRAVHRGEGYWVEYSGKSRTERFIDPASYFTLRRAEAVAEALNATHDHEVAAHRRLLKEMRRG